ncbi:hypothetical protein LR032_00275 [Candidatus Bipolaricaulota bacterium]|nr:hypothetical protein [Candidatus Bipolaricaulota bacterium]
MSENPLPFSLSVKEKMERQRIGTISYPIGQTGHRVRAGTDTWSQAMILMLLGAVIIAGLCFLYLRQETMILELTARQKDALVMLTAVEEVNLELEFRIKQAFSLARVSRIACDILNMVEPAVIHYVYIDLARTQRD